MTRLQATAISAVATLSLLAGMVGIVHRSAAPPARAQTIVVQQAGPASPAPPGEPRQEED